MSDELRDCGAVLKWIYKKGSFCSGDPNMSLSALFVEDALMHWSSFSIWLLLLILGSKSGYSKAVNGMQSNNSGVKSVASNKSEAKVIDGKSNGMQESPAIGAKYVRSSGSSLSTVETRTKLMKEFNLLLIWLNYSTCGFGIAETQKSRIHFGCPRNKQFGSDRLRFSHRDRSFLWIVLHGFSLHGAQCLIFIFDLTVKKYHVKLV